MKKSDVDPLSMRANFIDKGKVYLVRCPWCKLENYAPTVSSGICTWCGYDSKDYNLKKEHNGNIE